MNSQKYSNPSTHNRIIFHGAAQEVTGSCHKIEFRGKNYLLDCGIRQGIGSKIKKHENNFPFNAKSIDIVIISHAHLDHSGMLPRLIHEGFDGPIYASEGTVALLKILLEDSAHIYLKDLEYENIRRKRSGKPELCPEYTMLDVKKVMEQCHPIPYDNWINPATDVQLKFNDAGHILGSSIVEIQLQRNNKHKTIVFSGDLGNEETSLMPLPTYLRQADIVLMEGTYGDRNHASNDSTIEEFKAILRQAKKDKGNILIPSFAVGRTQELLFRLGLLYHEKELEGWEVFLDSPMATSVTEMYDRFINTLDPKDVKLMKQYQSYSLKTLLPNLHLTANVEESMAINRIKDGAIIIAGSGMCTGGRIRHHFKHRLWNRDNHVVFVGYQAKGTLGRILVDGVKHIKLSGQDIIVKAQIHTLGGFSAHAGQSELIKWAKHFENNPSFWLVHGEEKALNTLAEKLWEEADISANIATPNGFVNF